MLRIGLLPALLLSAILVPTVLAQSAPAVVDPLANSLFRQMNHERVTRSLLPMRWDAALGRAAEIHLKWQIQSAELSHQFAGEPDLAARAASAGAHLSVVAENLALGSDAATIHSGWMHSPHHRDNILDSKLNAVGFAVAHTERGYLVVADYGRRVEELSSGEVEPKIALLLKQRGVTVSAEHARARAACAVADGAPAGKPPRFLMRWQSPDLTVLPRALLQRLSGFPNSVASVGACPAQDAGDFSSYRIAVLLD
jgi:hypothetical protein